MNDFVSITIYFLVASLSVFSANRARIIFRYLKPIPILFLIVFLLFISGIVYPGNLSILILGLSFSAIGDILLLNKESIRFKLGLLSFAVAHLFYILFFFMPPEPNFNLIFVGMLYTTFAIVIYSLLKGYVDAIRNYILLYVVLITTMGIITFNYSLLSCNNLLLSPAVGGILFIISDSLLAWNKFRKPINKG
ncbi:MAG: lysoplasmalogenase, partial [Ignavibacteria bacterium]